ncbi:ArsR/SmtB family transcription factor [Thalassobius sp. S69A]|uniref:ArsR/SmtB family transcription factor n=1 Tax=unclassified Thalassovita TaxID=2619711 RepID=UPI000C0EE708|nr:transcriptional regulator [Paracoccaceae bacterium]MBT26865.1 transcriptional regulator [Paracoccaceae bacterium]|tara:strand:+ start:125 stop:457 length:333 start_codon:yes stop_codon:yes gene_type:complete
MDKTKALDSFAALGQDTRLEAFRLLVKAGPKGMAAGDVAAALGVKQNTMSANLSVLFQAGLVRNMREGRSIRYFADFDGLRGLLAFLMEDCCGGNPDICRPVLETLTCKC